jgi:hypothetical protein
MTSMRDRKKLATERTSSIGRPSASRRSSAQR